MSSGSHSVDEIDLSVVLSKVGQIGSTAVGNLKQVRTGHLHQAWEVYAFRRSSL